MERCLCSPSLELEKSNFSGIEAWRCDQASLKIKPSSEGVSLAGLSLNREAVILSLAST